MKDIFDDSMGIAESILVTLFEMGRLLPLPLEAPNEWVRRQRRLSQRQYSNSFQNLKRRGMIKVVQKNNRKFIEVTSEGQLEVLLLKTALEKPKKWDNKWRLFMFDIPEDSKEKRFQLRGLLKKNNFVLLQGSVYVSPYPLNREGIEYLKRSGLDRYIKIAKVEEFDDDTEIKKKFGLS